MKERRWIKNPSWQTRQDGDRRVCTTCETPVRGYAYRYYPPESDSFERCVGFGWCTACRFFSGNMVYVPRRKVLYDALAHLPADERDRLRHSEAKLIAYLDTLVRPDGPTRLDEQPPARS